MYTQNHAVNAGEKEKLTTDTIYTSLIEKDEVIPADLSSDKHCVLLNSFLHDNDKMDGLICEACYSEEKKSFLDQIVYEYIKECANILFSENRYAEIDAVEDLFFEYSKLDLNEVAQEPYPRLYISSFVLEHARAEYIDAKNGKCKRTAPTYEAICRKIMRAVSVPIELDSDEEEIVLYKFVHSNDEMDDLVRKASCSDTQKKILDQLIYEYVKSCSEGMFRRKYFASCVHAGLEEGDVINELFIAYFDLDLTKVATQPYPKRYIIRVLTNKRDKLYSNERTIVPVLSKASSSRRKLYKTAMTGDIDSIKLDELKPELRGIISTVVWCTKTPASLGDNLIDRRSTDPHKTILNRQICDILIEELFKTPLFQKPVVRDLFTYVYIADADEDLTPYQRTLRRGTAIREKYGLSSYRYLNLLKKIDECIKECWNNIPDADYQDYDATFQETA